MLAASCVSKVAHGALKGYLGWLALRAKLLPD